MTESLPFSSSHWVFLLTNRWFHRPVKPFRWQDYPSFNCLVDFISFNSSMLSQEEANQLRNQENHLSIADSLSQSSTGCYYQLTRIRQHLQLFLLCLAACSSCSIKQTSRHHLVSNSLASQLRSCTQVASETDSETSSLREIHLKVEDQFHPCWQPHYPLIGTVQQQQRLLLYFGLLHQESISY